MVATDFKTGSYVKVNGRGKSYVYSSEGSEGRIVGFATDETSNNKIAMVRFYKLTKDFEQKNPIWPVYLSSISKIKRNIKGKTINGVKYFYCEDCGEIFKDILMKKIQGYKICSKCFKNYNICKHCGGFLLKTLGKSSSTKDFYCNNCYKKLFTICVICNKEKELEKTKKGIEGKDYCENCYNLTFSTCDKCGDLFFKTRLKFNPRRNLYYCVDCFEEEKIIKNYTYMPRKLNFNKNKWDNDLMMGVELEVQCMDSENKAEDLKEFLTQEKLYSNFYFKEDGSLRDNNNNKIGFEIVTHPFSLQHAHKNMKFKYILKWLKDNKFVSYWGGKCGLHVHLSKNFFSSKEIKKMRIFHSINYEKVYTFSKRGSSGNQFCHAESFSKQNYFNKNQSQSGRHYCLNTDTGKPTVELRIFRGTLNFDRFLATLQYCDAISHFIKDVSVVYLLKTKSWGGFRKWAEEQNRYDHMVKYFKNFAL